MKALIGSLTFGVVLAITAGCEGGWQFGGSASQINESGNWMDVSGTYIPLDKSSYLVSDYSNFLPTNSSLAMMSEVLFTTVTNTLNYSGSLSHPPIAIGGLSVQLGGAPLVTVTVANRFATLGGGVTGGINLDNGAYTITVPVAYTTNQPLTVVYQATSAPTSVNPGGSSGIISTFSVSQSGNAIRIMDNNGSVYTGQIALTETNTPLSSNTNVAPTAATYQYDATGVSAAGMNVELVGNFLVSGNVTAGTNVTFGTIITGTWLEQGGKTGHISGKRQ
jgi:hypothetical protein